MQKQKRTLHKRPKSSTRRNRMRRNQKGGREEPMRGHIYRHIPTNVKYAYYDIYEGFLFMINIHTFDVVKFREEDFYRKRKWEKTSRPPVPIPAMIEMVDDFHRRVLRKRAKVQFETLFETMGEMTCSICLEPIVSEDTFYAHIVNDDIAHPFHEDCIAEYCHVNRQCVCPECRGKLPYIPETRTDM